MEELVSHYRFALTTQHCPVLILQQINTKMNPSQPFTIITIPLGQSEATSHLFTCRITFSYQKSRPIVFVARDSTKSLSTEKAAKLVCSYLSQQFPITEPEFISHADHDDEDQQNFQLYVQNQNQNQNSNSNSQINSNPVETDPKIQESISKLIANFQLVYNPTEQTDAQMVDQLNALYSDRALPAISIQTVRLSNTYRANVYIDRLITKSIFHTHSRSSCLQTALSMAITFLRNLSSLIEHVWRLYYTNAPNFTPKSSALEVVRELIKLYSKNDQILKMMMSTRVAKSNCYQTEIKFVKYVIFEGRGQTEAESKKAAACKALDYFQNVAKMVNFGFF